MWLSLVGGGLPGRLPGRSPILDEPQRISRSWQMKGGQRHAREKSKGYEREMERESKKERMRMGS